MSFDPSLIFNVRRQLNDVPEDFLTDEAIFQALRQADAYLSLIVIDELDDTYRNHCLVLLASYFAYSIYVSSVERGLGSIPAASEVRLRHLQKLAYTAIRPVAKIPIREDLTIDTDALADARPAVASLTESVLDG